MTRSPLKAIGWGSGMEKRACLTQQTRMSFSRGRMAFDPVFDGESVPVEVSGEEGPSIAFSRFITLMRRRREFTIEKLANAADVDVTALVQMARQAVEDLPSWCPLTRTAARDG